MSDIGDYALIGDCRSAALVSKEGSIDWLCWPHFDSPSLFGALLDARSGGRWRLAPVGPFETARGYEPGTNVLHTRFRTQTGVVRVTDLMPVASEPQKRVMLVPEHEVLRLVACEEGEVALHMVFEPRPDYARAAVRLREAGALGVRMELPRGLLTLRTDLPLDLHPRGLESHVRLRAGERRHASLTYTVEQLAVLPPLGSGSCEALARSVAWWRAWIQRSTYRGPWREAVLRSALLLKLLVFAPSGAVVAAPTTSLPERVGGDLNWDYRYCWLRDASLVLRALFGLGYHPEAEAFLSWLLHSTRLTRPTLRVLYDVFGKEPRPEFTLPHLAGFQGSRPVRVGNAAEGQLQLDIYGEVLDATTLFVREGGELDRETQRLLVGFGDYVCGHWSLADEGIWEPRRRRRRHTHSRVLCWVALDRLVTLHRQHHLKARQLDTFVRMREALRQDIETHGWNARLKSYVATYGEEGVDASLLLLPWYRFTSPQSPRMKATFARIEAELSAGPALLFRHRAASSHEEEGALGICSFWAAEYLAQAGALDEAVRRVELLLGYRNDVGLYAEEMAPGTGKALGNFPQGFTHVGLVNAALTVEKRLRGQEPLRRQVPRRQAHEAHR